MITKEDKEFVENNPEILCEVVRRHEERIANAILNSGMVHVSLLYNPQPYMNGNKLDMFKYGTYIHNIPDSEVASFSASDKQLYLNSVEYIKREDGLLMEAFDKMMEGQREA